MKLGQGMLLTVAAVVVVVAIAAVYLWSSLDSIVAAAIEKYGSQTTQTDVRVSSVKLSLTAGEGVIEGLTVGNPSGFTEQHVFRLGKITTRIDLATVRQDPIVIDEIVVNDPRVFYEINRAGQSNVSELKKRLPSSGGQPEDSGRCGGEGHGGELPGGLAEPRRQVAFDRSASPVRSSLAMRAARY
jgi:hypothetical protein